MSTIAFSSAIGPIKLDVVLSENHLSSIEITGNPIETGAEVNDHAYIKPKEVILEIADKNAALTYNALIAFQESRVPFFLMTGLKLYKDMLVEIIDAFRDKDNHSILSARVILRQVIIVSTATSSDSQTSGSGDGQSVGQPGGNDSRIATPPSAEASNNPTTADRAAGTVLSGDTSAATIPPAQSQSILKGIFG